MQRGWWYLSIEMFSNEEPDDSTLEHIAKLVKEGYTQGEVLQETDEEEEEE